MTLAATNYNETAIIPQATVLAIGPWHHGEFALLQPSLNGASDWLRSKNYPDALTLLSENEWSPEFILIAQPLPGDVSQCEIEQLRQAAPLAHIVIVAGSWCEGELRTGQPPEGVLRMYWHEFANWWPSRMQSDWSACLDGPFAARDAKPINQAKSSFLVAIHSPTFALFDAISSTLAVSGHSATWIRDVSMLPAELDTGMWDGGQLDVQELADLKAFATEVQSRSGKLVVLLDFPRKQHFELLQELSCHAILGKPYIVEELIAACTS
jgi:hypothetical protein